MLIRTICALVLASCLVAGCASSPRPEVPANTPGQESQSSPAELRRQARRAIASGDWALAGMSVLMLDPADAANRDVLSQTLSLLGRDDLLAPSRANAGSQECAVDGDAEHPDALTEIVRRARDHSVVVINEAHDNSRHRAFVDRVVRALRAEGFDTFAAETLRHPTDELAARRYVTAADGYYTKDPVFAQLVITAIELGYRIVAYEFSGPYPENASAEARMDLREQRQAEQLFERTFARASQTRLVVLVGYGHVAEEPRPPGSPGPPLMMAGHLKRMLGRDILTIDQTVCIAHSQLRDASDLGYLRAAGAPRATARSIDIQMVRGQEQLQHGRATWRVRDGRRAIAIPRELQRRLRDFRGVVVIEARPVGAVRAAIPEDRVLWRPQDRDLRLVLRPGDYELIVLGAENRQVAVASVRAR